jgi:hypothetical protein
VSTDHPLAGGFARPSAKKKQKKKTKKVILATHYFYVNVFSILLNFFSNLLTFKRENIASVKCCIQFEIISAKMNQE